MQRLDRILALIDPTVDAQPAARKAERLAQLSGATVERFDVADFAREGEPLHEAVLRRVAECEPDLVVKDTHVHPELRRALFSNADWHLVRSCPVPLLLSRTDAWPAQPRILAALDPAHHADKPAAPDVARIPAEIVGGQRQVAHFFHGAGGQQPGGVAFRRAAPRPR